MNTVYFNSTMDDDCHRGEFCRVRKFDELPALSDGAHCAFTTDLTERACSPLDTRAAPQKKLPLEETAEALYPLKFGVHLYAKTRPAIVQTLDEHDRDFEEAYLDFPHLRALISKAHLIAYPARVQGVRPHAHTRSAAVGALLPTPKLRAETPPIGSKVISASSRHATVTKHSGDAHLSTDFHITHCAESSLQTSATNIDSASTGTMIRDYIQESSVAIVPGQIPQLYGDHRALANGLSPPRCQGIGQGIDFKCVH